MQPTAIANEFMPRDHNVNAVYRGFKFRNGRRTNVESVVFAMRRKRPLAELHGDEVIPAQIDGDPTDVIEVPMFEAPRPIPPRPQPPSVVVGAEAFTQRIRPAEPGYSIGHPDITAGTFGLAVKWGPTADWWLLSNNHVIADSNDGELGDFVRQPGPHDGGTTSDRIARLAEFAEINFEGAPGKPKAAAGRVFWKTIKLLGDTPAKWVGCKNRVHVRPQAVQQPTPNLIDCGIARAIDQQLISTVIRGIGQPREIRQVSLGRLTTKKGRTTEITRLICDGVDGTIRVRYGGGRIAVFHHQDLYRAEDGGEGSAGGDSGSAIVSRDGAIWYSLLFAGGGGLTVGNRAIDCVAVMGNGLRIQ